MSHGNLVLRNSISTCIFSCPFFCIVPSLIFFLKTSHVQYTGFENPILFAPQKIQNFRICVKNKSTFEKSIKMWGASPLQLYTCK